VSTPTIAEQKIKSSTAAPVRSLLPPQRPAFALPAEDLPPASLHGRKAAVHDLINVAIHSAPEKSAAQSCPLPAGPRTCPFGGAWHACPTRVQTKLAVGAPDDEFEREADRMAEEITRTTETPVARRKCGRCGEDDEEEELRRKPVSNAVDMFEVLPEMLADVEKVTDSSGNPLDAKTRTMMEARFGWDFGRVRVHTNDPAAASAQAVNARAYTIGEDMVFARGQYAPQTSDGNRLLAHELTHVIQQGGYPSPATAPVRIGAPSEAPEQEADHNEKTAPESRGAILEIGGAKERKILHSDPSSRLRRAVYTVGPLQIQIDYGLIWFIPTSDFVTEIETRYSTWTGAPPAASIHTDLTALSSDAQRWVLYGLHLLMDNTRSGHGRLDRTAAAQRLIARAPSASTTPHDRPGFPFEDEVMRVSGWFEVALASRLTDPTTADLATMTSIYNPATGALDTTRLRAEIPPLLTAFLIARDPGRWTTTGTHSMPALQTIGDRIQNEARTFFGPYADVAIANKYSEGWQYSAHIFDAATVTASLSASDLTDRRNSYMTNRAEMVGRMTGSELGNLFSINGHAYAGPIPVNGLFTEVNFNSSDPTHRSELDSIVRAMANVPNIQAMVDRHLRHTGVTEGDTGRVGIQSVYGAVGSITECDARWNTIHTLAHELVHVLVHSNFPDRGNTVQFGQIVVEGFTTVLGRQLHDHLRSKAGTDPTFKAQMEAGLSGACPAPTPAALGYGQAGASAERIRAIVFDDAFRAAYFLGAVHLVGLGTSPQV
jgi:hypothetical protein